MLVQPNLALAERNRYAVATAAAATAAAAAAANVAVAGAILRHGVVARAVDVDTATGNATASGSGSQLCATPSRELGANDALGALRLKADGLVSAPLPLAVAQSINVADVDACAVGRGGVLTGKAPRAGPPAAMLGTA